MRSMSVLLLAALSVTTSSAWAQFGPGSQKLDLVSRFDTDGDGWLDAKERAAARAALHSGAVAGRYWRGDFDSSSAPVSPGKRLTSADVKHYGQEPLFDINVLRTVFITLTDKDWEQELMDFYRTDVDVPATVVVDGKTYNDVGVHFRGMTSFRMVGAGHKHSMDLAFDFLHKDQRLLGYKKIELLNSAADPTFLRSALYMYIMRQYVPAPQANYMRVVINGENWGVYVNEEHLTAEFTQDAVGYSKAMRWKVPGSPRARGGLEYMGEDPAPYERVFEIKSKDKPESWQALIHLCKVLNETPPDRLPAALAPILDVDGVLRFLAVEKALINNDGYWVRSSDYSVYTDANGRFHVAPHDANETLRPTEEMMWGGLGGDQDQVPGNSIALDPMANVHDPAKPLISKLLAVPAWRQRYLGYVRDVATHWLDWKQLGPVVEHFQSVIDADVRIDTRKLFPTDTFKRAVYEDNAAEVDGGPISPPGLGLKSFADQRRTYLLKWLAEHPNGE